jgi:hypothetical protein
VTGRLPWPANRRGFGWCKQLGAAFQSKDHPMTNPKTPRRMARAPYQPADPNDVGSKRADLQTADLTDKRVTKRGQVVAMLRADCGATLAAIVTVTGWQAHTVRAALTGLRKNGHTIERSSVDGETRYRLIEVAAE